MPTPSMLTDDDVAKLAILPISHPKISIQMRYFRECEAMLAHYLARGITIPEEKSHEIGELAPILRGGAAMADQVDFAALHQLHTALSQAIRPALPRTIELLQWDSRAKPLAHKIAPVPAIRWLMLMTVLFFLLMYGCVLVAGNVMGAPGLLPSGLESYEYVSQMFSKPLLHLSGQQLLLVTGFYAGLAGLGSCFSVLYDARSYVIEGTYDPRHGSNYIIRIVLGIVAGLILTQLIAEPSLASNGSGSSSTTQAPTLPFGKPIIALLGGFASQFVYKGLNKMVDAMSSIFEPNREEVIHTRAEQIRVETAQATMAATVDRVTDTVQLIGELTKDPDKLKKPETLGRLLEAATNIGGQTAVTKTALGTALGPSKNLLDRASGLLSAGKLMAKVMPDNQVSRVLKKAGALKDSVDEIRGLTNAGATTDAKAQLLQLDKLLPQIDPTKQILSTAVKALGRVPAIQSIAGGPSGVALALVIGSIKLGGIAYKRWKTRVLEAGFTQDLAPPSAIDAAMTRNALRALPDLSVPLQDRLMGNSAALNDFGRQAMAQQDGALFALYGEEFGKGRPAFNDVMDEFRQLMVGELLITQDDLGSVLAEANTENARELFDAFDEARGDPEALAAMDQLFLVATNSKTDPEAQAGLLDSLRSLDQKDAA